MLTSPLKPHLLAAAVSAFAATTAMAADSDNRASAAPEVETIMVTATRVEQRLEDVARSLSFVDRNQIDVLQGQSVAELLAYQPNITVSGGPRAGSQNVNIRGLGGNKVLQTIDGARLSFESGHRPSYFLDPELLKGVEALRGPAGSLWGTGALGGVVAQRTVDPADLRRGKQLGGFVRSGYNANSNQNFTTLALAGGSDELEGLLSAYRRDSNDLELGDGSTLLGSAAEDQGLLAKLDWRPGERHTLRLNLRGSDSKGTIPANGAAEINATSNFLVDRDIANRHANLRWDYLSDSAWFNPRALVYWNRVDIDEARSSDGRADSTLLDEYGINLLNSSSFEHFDLVLGADVYREDFGAARSGSFRPLPPAAVTDVWSLYAQGTVPLRENLRLELGLRRDDFTTEAQNLGERRTKGDTTGSAALIWDVLDGTTLALRYDEAFRAPTAEELYTTGTHFCIFPRFCNGFVPNPDLVPEQAANVELLGQFDFGQALGADQVGMQVSVFENRVDNFIEQIVIGPFFAPVRDPGTTTWVNVDAASIRGFEWQGSYRRKDLQLRLNYGQTRGEERATGADLTNIPADTFVADLSQGFLDNSVVAGLRLTHARAQNRTDYPENTGGLRYDGYTITDLYASWRPASLSQLKLDLVVNNLQDEFYQRAWSQLPAVGRELIVAARYSF